MRCVRSKAFTMIQLPWQWFAPPSPHFNNQRFNNHFRSFFSRILPLYSTQRLRRLLRFHCSSSSSISMEVWSEEHLTFPPFSYLKLIAYSLNYSVHLFHRFGVELITQVVDLKVCLHCKSCENSVRKTLCKIKGTVLSPYFSFDYNS